MSSPELATVVTNAATGEDEVVGVVLEEGIEDDEAMDEVNEDMSQQQALIDQAGREQGDDDDDDIQSRNVVLGVNVKEEMDEDEGEALATVSDVVDSMEPNALLQLVSGRVFEYFSIWDLILHKARGNQVTTGVDRAVDSVLEDTERVLVEVKHLMKSCMEPVSKKDLGRGKRKPKEAIDVSDLLTTALDIEEGAWRRKDPKKINYECCVELPNLFGAEGFEIDIKEESGPMSQLKASATEDEDATVGNRNRVQPMVDDTDKDPDFRKQGVTKGKRGRGRPPKTAAKPAGRGRPRVDVRAPKSRPKRNKKPTFKLRFLVKTEGQEFFCEFEGCDQATDPFPSKEKVEEHFNDMHVKAENKVVPCHIENCNEKFALTFQRNAHMEAVHERGFGCAKCDKKFWRNKEAEEHIARAHGDNPANENFDPSCVCVKCGKKFNSKTYVDQHEAKCDGLFVRQPRFTKFNGEYICSEPDCNVGHGFSGEYGLRVHFYDYHLREEEKVYQCETCGQKFGLRTMLNKHVNTAHDKKYACDYCGKRFGGKDKLQTHTYTHTGEKPFDCNKCDYRTAKKYNLDQHKASKHQDFGDRPFHCDLCGKQFYSAGRVLNHKKVIHRDGRNIGGKKKAKAAAVGPATTTTVMQTLPLPASMQATNVVQGTPVVMITADGKVTQQAHIVEESEAAVEYITTELDQQSGVMLQYQ